MGRARTDSIWEEGLSLLEQEEYNHFYLVDAGEDKEDGFPLVIVSRQWNRSEPVVYERFREGNPRREDSNIKVAVEPDIFDHEVYSYLGSSGDIKLYDISEEDRNEYRSVNSDYYAGSDTGLEEVKSVLD